MCDLRGIVNFKLATYHYDEDHWSNESPYEVCIIPQPAPAYQQQPSHQLLLACLWH